MLSLTRKDNFSCQRWFNPQFLCETWRLRAFAVKARLNSKTHDKMSKMLFSAPKRRMCDRAANAQNFVTIRKIVDLWNTAGRFNRTRPRQLCRNDIFLNLKML